MPGGVPVQAAPTFQQQFQEIMFYLGPIAQLLFWAALAVAAIWAVILFRKMVALKAIEVGVDVVVAEDAIDAADSKKPDVDEFVE